MSDKKLLIEEIKKLEIAYPDLKANKLFEQACYNLKFKILKYFREDINMIFLFSCQIILNGKYMNIGKGKTPDDAYINAIFKICNYFDNNEENYFIDEINQNINNIDICDEFIEYCQNYFQNYPAKLSKSHRINFKNIKEKLKSNPNFKSLSETYRSIKEDKIICSIYLDEKLILHQSCGKNEIEALENTAKELFMSYSIISNPKDETESKTEEIIKDKDVIIGKMFEKFKENKSYSVNYWIILEKCAQDLGFKMAIHNNKKKCAVNINDVEIINIDCDNDYCGYISACKDLLQLFENVTEGKNPLKEIIWDSKIRDKKIKAIVTKAKSIRQNDPSSPVWPIVNNAFLDDEMKLELHYGNMKSKIICSFDCQGLQIVFAEGDNQLSSREAAALKLLDDPLYSNY